MNFDTGHFVEESSTELADGVQMVAAAVSVQVDSDGTCMAWCVDPEANRIEDDAESGQGSVRSEKRRKIVAGSESSIASILIQALLQSSKNLSKGENVSVQKPIVHGIVDILRRLSTQGNSSARHRTVDITCSAIRDVVTPGWLESYPVASILANVISSCDKTHSQCTWSERARAYDARMRNFCRREPKYSLSYADKLGVYLQQAPLDSTLFEDVLSKMPLFGDDEVQSEACRRKSVSSLGTPKRSQCDVINRGICMRYSHSDIRRRIREAR